MSQQKFFDLKMKPLHQVPAVHVRLPGDARHHEPRLERRRQRVGPARTSLERGLDLNLSHPQHRHDQNSAENVLEHRAGIV